ncbi:MAG: glycosyltransferase family 39 protein [Bryobacteraceae bacterium]
MAAIFAGYLFTTFSIFGAGLWLVRRLRIEVSPAETAGIAWVTGASLYSLLVLALCVLHAIQVPVLLLLGCVGIVLGWSARPRQFALPGAGFAAVAVFLTVYFVAAMAPSLDSDGYRYHLGFPRLYIDAGGLIPIREDFYSAFPQGMEMLYLFGLRLGGFSVANLLHWNFLAALTAGIYGTGIRYSSPLAALCASLAVAASPVMGTTAASASVDVALAAAIWISFHGWLRWLDTVRWEWLVIGSIGAGFACAIKYTGVTALCVSGAFVLSCSSARRRNLLLSGLVSAVWILPWLARNWIYFDNPFHPFLSAWFPNPYLLPSSEKAWLTVVRSYNGAAFDSGYPWEAAIRGTTTAGIAGPFFLLAPLAVLGVATRVGGWTVAAGVITALAWVAGNPIVRFAIPTMPFAALAVSEALARHRWTRPILIGAVALHAAMCFPPWIERWNKQWIPTVKQIPWREAFRFTPPELFWQREIPAYPAVRYLDAHSGVGARVLAFDEQPQFFTSRLLANFYSSEEAISAEQLLRRAADPASWPSLSCAATIAAAPYRWMRITQQEPDRYAEWSIFEAEAEGENAASLQAFPNVWEAPSAGDGSDVTPWSSKEPRVAGMWFQMEWRQARALRNIRLVSSPAHAGVMTFAVSSDGREWRPVAAGFECQPRPVNEFRKRSAGELKRRGWTHVMTGRSYPWLTQALQDPDGWGIRERFRNGDVRLLELDAGP